MPVDRPAPAECANCGAAIPPNAHACPECGADERTGWRETSVYDNLDLPESAWNDNRVDSPEAKETPDRRVNGIAWYWWCVGVLVALVVGLSLVWLR